MAGLATTVRAHEGRPPEPHDLLSSWSLEPLVVTGLVLSAWLYLRGLRLIERRRAFDGDLGSGSLRTRALAFAGGWATLLIALVSPLDALGAALFTAHMTQHELLMLIAAPLLVLGRPLVPMLVALPAGMRRRLARSRRSRWGRLWRWVFNPLAAWLIHAAVLWLWHVPALFEATLESEIVHAAQHLSFLVSALVFCEALVYGDEGRMGYGAAVIYLFTTAVHTSVLGALLTFSATLWYPVYQTTTAVWGLTPLEDQQLGGLVMWVPAGLVYTVAGLLLTALWLKEAERRVSQREVSFIGASGQK